MDTQLARELALESECEVDVSMWGGAVRGTCAVGA